MPEQEKSAEVAALLAAEEPALTDVRRARELAYSQPEHKRALEKLAGALKEELESARSSEKRKELSLRLGAALWVLKRYEEAAKVLEGAGKSAVGQFLYGLCLARTGAAGALEALEQAREGGAAAFEVDMASVPLLCARGQVEAAIKLVKKHEKAHHGSPELHLEKARCLEASGEYAQAVGELERAVELEPKHAPALFRLAYLCDRLGDEARALELYRRCIELQPLRANALMNLGVLYEDRGEPDRAIACYRRVLHAEPTHERARLYLKDALASKTMYYDEEAVKRMDRTGRVLRSPISDFELSVRSRNCLKKMNIHSLGDLVRYTEEQLLTFKNFGETSLAEIKRLLVSKGLHLGMSVEGAGLGPALPERAGLPPTEDERVLLEPIEQLELSVRSRKCLGSLGIKTVGELIDRSPEELLACKNFGQTSLEEIREKLRQLGLCLRESELPDEEEEPAQEEA